MSGPINVLVIGGEEEKVEDQIKLGKKRTHSESSPSKIPRLSQTESSETSSNTNSTEIPSSSVPTDPSLKKSLIANSTKAQEPVEIPTSIPGVLLLPTASSEKDNNMIDMSSNGYPNKEVIQELIQTHSKIYCL